MIAGSTPTKIMGRDDDGQGVTGGVTVELMHGADIRLLIPSDTKASTGELLMLLRKAAAWIESGALAFIAEGGEGSGFPIQHTADTAPEEALHEAATIVAADRQATLEFWREMRARADVDEPF